MCGQPFLKFYLDDERLGVKIEIGTPAIRAVVVVLAVRPGYLGEVPTVPIAVIENEGATGVIEIRTVARVTASFMTYATTYFKTLPLSV